MLRESIIYICILFRANEIRLNVTAVLLKNKNAVCVSFAYVLCANIHKDTFFVSRKVSQLNLLLNESFFP